MSYLTLISVQHVDTPTCYKTLILSAFCFLFFFLVKFRLISFCFEFALQVTPLSNFVLELKFNKIIIFCDKKYNTSMRNQRTFKAMHWYESILELDFLNCHYNFVKDNDNKNLDL